MNEEVEFALDAAEEAMKNGMTHLDGELRKVRAGRATPSMLDSVMVEYYGTPTHLSKVANVNTLDARTLTVQPWEKSILEAVAMGITNANLGLNPQNNGEMIIINVPQLTEERRRDLTKRAKAAGENAKVTVRSARKEANNMIKGLTKDGLSEDLAKTAEDKVQKLTNDYTAKIDVVVEAKEKDIMTV